MEGAPSNRSLRPAVVVGSILATAAFITGFVVFGAVACSGPDLRSGLGGDMPSNPDELLAELKSDRERIDTITESMAERVRAFNASRQPGEPTLDVGAIFQGDFTGAERDVLNEMLASEQDLSYKTLLQELVRERDAVRGLQERILRLEQTFPDQFVVAAKGDSQYDLAMRYLTEQAGVEPARAKSTLESIDMTDELLPGNRVWFFHDADRDSFRTYVTRGEATQTPVALRRTQKRLLTSERDEARLRAEALATDLDMVRAEKESEVARLSGEIESLARRRWELEREVSQLETRVTEITADLERQENSVFFHAAAEKELRERGALTPVLKRFRDGSVVRYDHSLDLTQGKSIRIEAADLGLERIDKVELLPTLYQPERDYVIERAEDGSEATIVILEPEIFRGKEVLLSVKG
jgi:hypothetical protein